MGIGIGFTVKDSGGTEVAGRTWTNDLNINSSACDLKFGLYPVSAQGIIYKASQTIYPPFFTQKR